MWTGRFGGGGAVIVVGRLSKDGAGIGYNDIASGNARREVGGRVKGRENPFEIRADEYDRWFETARGARIFRIELECLRKAIGAMEGRWLEIGVGAGRFAQALGIRFGVDPSPAMVKIAAGRGVDACVAVAEALPFRDAAFDGALFVCSMCFLDDPRVASRECGRILKDNGRLVIGFVPANSPWGACHAARGERGHPFYASARFYVSDELQRFAEDAGFALQAERGLVLPPPDGPLSGAAAGGTPLREESFAVLCFKLKKNGGGAQA